MDCQPLALPRGSWRGYVGDSNPVDIENFRVKLGLMQLPTIPEDREKKRRLVKKYCARDPGCWVPDARQGMTSWPTRDDPTRPAVSVTPVLWPDHLS